MDIDDFGDEFDDFQLDAESLKVLQDTEDRYTLYSQSSAHPAVKREQTYQPIPRSKPPPSSKSTRPLIKREGEDDSLPDVSVNNDGTYSFQPTQKSVRQPPPSTRVTTGLFPQAPETSLPKSSTPPQRPRGSFVPPANAGAFTRSIAPLPKYRDSASTSDPQLPNDAKIDASTPRAPVPDRHQTTIDPSRPPPAPHVKRSGVDTTQASRIAASEHSNAAMEQMRKEMELLRAEKETMEKSLKDAKNATLVRDGEIATLRRTMEKQTAVHTETLDKIRAEKSSIENKKAVMEAELNAEMERLKSKLIFKQQEIETASMRYLNGPPSTARKHRNVPPSQLQTPVQPRTSSSRGNVDVSPSIGRFTTPMHRRVLPIEKSDAKKENSPFPGFLDSFQSRGVKKSPSKKPVGALVADDDRPPMPRSSQEYLGSDDPFQDHLTAPVQDEDMEDSVSQSPREAPVRWGTNWPEELHNLVFTHCSLLPGSRTPQVTIQILLSAAIPTDDGVSRYNRYVKACGDLFTSFGTIGSHASRDPNPEEDGQYQHLVRDVGASLLGMAYVFLETNMVLNIQCLLRLLQTVVYALPSFREYLLTTPLSPDEPRALHEVLCVYLREHPEQDIPLQSPYGIEGEGFTADVLGVLDALLWTVPNSRIVNLECFTSDVTLLSNLLQPSQPHWLILKTTRLLVFLSAHVQLVPSLIERSKNKPSGPSHHVDAMLRYIHKIDTDISLKSGCDLIHTILIFLTNICVLHGKVEAMRTNFPNLVPSLLLCLTEISNRFWRDDEETRTGSEGDMDALINILIPSLNLFHYLFYGIEFDSHSLAVDLRNVLLQASILPPFNGIDHLYIVTMARLGYADVPDWLGPQRILVVENIQAVARELLEIFVDGPEGDLVVSTYDPDDFVPSQKQDETQEETLEDSFGDIMDLDP
ncbi:uncharacterized protein EI90DRAFT_3069670 [Cantharellus anzutake]|uniref:uncharacterized protein n=1 Tax=Cantharellus anzutake TaxID=1750568 RepID=UPI0019045342|nr:uncharacterized protein EI90DRAFT_3069670 [Cantharellus anzutake]KAF8326559.1 hypothetical protein EI90DRAFT_3069670 [Cantharellus anzutake]